MAPESYCVAPKGAGREAALGRSEKVVPKPKKATSESDHTSTRERLYRTQDALRPYQSRLTGRCGLYRIGAVVDVATYTDGAGKRRAVLQNVETCKNANVCPTCAHRIRSHRAHELAAQAEAHCAGYGGKDSLSLLTLTIRHHKGERLSELLDGEKRAYRLLKKWLSRWGYFNAWNWFGEVRSNDLTHGANGWHPHLHVLIFWKDAPSEQVLKHRREVISELWQKAVALTMGEEHRPNDAHGTHLANGENAARYIVKLCLEMSDPLSKEGTQFNGIEPGLTMWEVADTLAAGDISKLPLWREYAEAVKGSHVFEYSRRNEFRATLRTNAGQDKELTDEEIIEGGTGTKKALELPPETWNLIRKSTQRKLALLLAVETGGEQAGKAYLVSAGLWRRPIAEFDSWGWGPVKPPEEWN